MRCRMACAAPNSRAASRTSGVTSEIGEALKDVGNAHARLDIDGARQRVVDVADGLPGLTARSGRARTRRQGQHLIQPYDPGLAHADLSPTAAVYVSRGSCQPAMTR